MADAGQVKALFDRASELDPDDRDAFLRQACSGDERLIAEIQSLLRCDADAHEFLRAQVVKFSAIEASRMFDPDTMLEVGASVGPYVIDRPIGRGGMGTVYLAHHNGARTLAPVAVKFLRRGCISPSFFKRFENERKILADLDHPFIASLITAGTTEMGLPYLVMEYVEGVPIDRFCRVNRLSIDERLRLFQDICTAVQFAHERGVVHRDIKPSNILVTNEGTPKLLDFGIAKAANWSGAQTSTATALTAMTPEYASPEQMKGERIGKGSDIFSLGVLLYELICERPPHVLNSKSPYEIVRSICDEDPEPPSIHWRQINLRSSVETRTDAVAGGRWHRITAKPEELDAIVLTALRKEPERRYRSVSDFSEDIGRYLDGRPVKARRNSLLYSGSLLIGRYRTAAVIALSLALGLIGIGLLTGSFDVRAGNIVTIDPIPDPGLNFAAGPGQDLCGSGSSEANNLYLKGQHLWSQRSGVTINEAVGFFRLAVEKDPTFGAAYSSLANGYTLLGAWGALPPHEAFSHAREAAEASIRACPDLAEGHLSLAMVYWLYEWDWEGADREFRRAIDLNPNYTLAPHWYGLFLAEMGRFDEAVAAERRALEIEPLSIPINADLARVFFYARRYQDAREQYQRTIALNPKSKNYYGELVEFFETTGMAREWLNALQSGGLKLDREMMRAYRRGGIMGFRKRSFELVPASYAAAFDYYFSPAHRPMSAEAKDKAFELLERAFAERDHRMAQLKVSPRFDNLRDDPRFADLLKRLNLQP